MTRPLAAAGLLVGIIAVLYSISRAEQPTPKFVDEERHEGKPLEAPSFTPGVFPAPSVDSANRPQPQREKPEESGPARSRYVRDATTGIMYERVKRPDGHYHLQAVSATQDAPPRDEAHRAVPEIPPVGTFQGVTVAGTSLIILDTRTGQTFRHSDGKWVRYLPPVLEDARKAKDAEETQRRIRELEKQLQELKDDVGQ